MKSVYLSITILLINFISFAQDDGCETPLGNKRFKKYLEAGKNKKNDRVERLKNLKEAVVIEEECAECYYLIGLEHYKRAKSAGASYKLAEKYFSKLLEVCPNYHSDPYYFLGLIYYGQEKYESSLTHFKAFLTFEDEDDSKFAKDFDKKYDDVQEILPELEFFAELYNNPVPFHPSVVSGVSSSADEYLPMISPDNELMFYTRKYNKKSKGDIYGRTVEEFTMSTRVSACSEFDNGKALVTPFNMGDSYGGACISLNNKEIFITVCKAVPNGYRNCDIYTSRYKKYWDEEEEREKFHWTELENIGPQINTETGWEAQPSLTGDGKTLFFATARENSDKIDIYFSERDDNGQWQKAKSIGAKINSLGNDKSPFLHTDSKTLYFASDGRMGAGKYDIYFSRLGEGGEWMIPKNLGIPINTVNDEHGLIVSIDGKKAFFASNRLQGAKGLDIFSFELPDELKPQKILLIKGVVKDEKGELIEGAKVEIKYAGEKETTVIEADKDDGKYAYIVDASKNKDVIVSVNKEGYAFNSRIIRTEDIEKNAVANEEIEFRKIAVGESYKINNIYFATNSSEINNKSRYILDEFVEYLKKNKAIKISIQGHTDDVGVDNHNMVLSSARANSVKDYLISSGVSTLRLTAEGFGETKPVASNDTEGGKSLNRRTEFLVVSK